jgi:hypothetical protein
MRGVTPGVRLHCPPALWHAWCGGLAQFDVVGFPQSIRFALRCGESGNLRSCGARFTLILGASSQGSGLAAQCVAVVCCHTAVAGLLGLSGGIFGLSGVQGHGSQTLYAGFRGVWPPSLLAVA